MKNKPVFFESYKFIKFGHSINLPNLIYNIKTKLNDDSKKLSNMNLSEEYNIIINKNKTIIKYKEIEIITLERIHPIINSFKNIYYHLIRNKNTVTNINKVPIAISVAIINFLKAEVKLRIDKEKVIIITKSNLNNIYEITIHNTLYNLYMNYSNYKKL